MTDSDGQTMELNAVLFADLGDSTRLYEELGDARAHEIASACLGRLEAVVAEHKGRIVKHIGDEVMCVFNDSNDAVRAACEMQEKVCDPAAEPNLTIHIGLHWGPVLPEHGDVFGDAVNLAARVVSLAHPRQILTTGATIARLDSELREATRWIDRRHVKGKRGDIDIFEVTWEQPEERTEFKGVDTSEAPVSALWLRMGDIEITGDEQRPAITIGRDESNDLTIANQIVSRHHAKIERRVNKWVLLDHSINGTVVAPDHGQPAYVHNEQILMPDAGWLGIGNPADNSHELLVRFEQTHVS